jgi:hypothetical protein
MRPLTTTRRFERDLEGAKRRGKDLDKLWAVVERLVTGEPRLPGLEAQVSLPFPTLGSAKGPYKLFAVA